MVLALVRLSHLICVRKIANAFDTECFNSELNEKDVRFSEYVSFSIFV